MAGKKEIIMSAAEELLTRHSYKEITVLDIVEKSNVNRNTFYYHFCDMPDLIEALACRSIDAAFSAEGLSPEEKLCAAADKLYQNRKLVYHVYDFAERQVFDRGLGRVCGHLVKCLFACCSELQVKSAEEQKLLGTAYKALAYGLVSDLLSKGLDEDGRNAVKRLCGDIVKSIK